MNKSKVVKSDIIFHSLYENSPQGIIVHSGIEMIPLMANNAAEKILGYSEEELMCSDLNPIINSIDDTKLKTAVDKLIIEGEGVAETQTHVIRKDNSMVLLQLRISATRSSANEGCFIVFSFDDITQRKKVVFDQVEREANSKKLLNAYDGSALLTDVNGILLAANQGLAIRFNMNIDELIGKEIVSLLPPDIAATWCAKTALAIETGKSVSFTEAVNGQTLRHCVVPVPDQGALKLASFSRDITEEIRLKHELKLKTFTVEESMNGIALTDTQARLLYVNQSFLHLWGYTHSSEVLGQSAFNFCKRPEEAEEAARILLLQGSWEGELLALRKDQSIAIFQVSAKMLKDKDNSPWILKASFVDITEQKRIQQSLIESERTLKQAQSLAKVGSWKLDVQNNLMDCSDEICKICQLRNGRKLTTADFFAFIHPDDKTSFEVQWLKAIHEKMSFDFEHRVVAKGVVKWVRTLAQPEIEQDGHTSFVVGAMQDITERKMAEDAIRKKNNELKEIIDALDHSSLVSITDRKGVIVKVNKRFCQVAKYHEDELIGRNHKIINSGYHSKSFWAAFWKTIGDGEVWRGEIKNRAKDGVEYWVDTVINPLRNEDNEITHYLSIRQDITDRKMYEKLLLQSNSRLSQIERYIDVTTDAIQVSDEEGRLIYINKVASDRLGIEQNECPNYCMQNFDDAFREKDAWKRHVDKLKMGESLSTEGININRATAQRFPVEVTWRFVDFLDKCCIISVSRDISDRKKNEAALRESEARLTEAQRIAKLGYWELDLITNKVWWSEEQYEMNGIKPSSPLTQDVFINLLHIEDRQRFLDVMNKVITSGEDTTVVYRIVKPDGDVRIIQGKAHVSRNENRKPIRISGVNQDITERVMAEKALRESEQTLSKAQQVAKIGSWKLDVKNDILEWSAEVYKIFNVPQNKQITYEYFLTYVHPEDRAHVDNSWKAALKGDQYDIVHRIIVDKKIKWVREQAELTFNESRNLIYAFGTVQDITDQKILQEANLIFNQSQLLTGLGSWRRNIKTNELFWSDNVFNLFCLDKALTDVTFETFLHVIYQDDRERVKSTLDKSLLDKIFYEIEFRVEARPGEIRWFLGTGNVVADQEGNAMEMYGIVRDITAEKTQTQELLKAKRQAEEAALIKDEFLSVMSHEIRTPLNAVIGLSNLLIRRNPREDQIEVMRTMKGAADNLLHLVNDILDFNKIRAGKVELEFIGFSLNKFLKHLHAAFQLSAIDKGLDFSIQADARIPDLLVGDVTRLNQIFNNLLSNAIKFTHQGYVKLQVELKHDSKNKCQLTFKVEDTGLGIAPDKFQTIFQPFHQSERNISRQYGGTGLGLSIVKGLVEVLNGKLEMTSIPEKGSSFAVDLDFAIQGAGKENEPEKLIAAAQKISTSNRKQEVLYVEDVESNRFLIQNLLADNNINCVAVSSGIAALRVTKIRKFDVILMDIQMPGMDGYKVTEKIRKQRSGKNACTPVIAFTAEHYSESLKRKITEHGIQDAITKPFDTETLLKKMMRFAKSKLPQASLFTMSFYEKVFDNDKKRLNQIKRSIIRDIKKFETNTFSGYKLKNMKHMQNEIHRMRPILKNLACTSLIEVLDTFASGNPDSPAWKESSYKAKKIIKNLLVQLTALKY